MKPEEFTPRYELFTTHVRDLMHGVIVCFCFLGFYMSGDLYVLIVGILSLGFFLSNFLTRPRRILFFKDSFVVKRFLISDLTFFYEEISDIGSGLILCRNKKSFSFMDMKNSKELRILFSRLIKEGRIDKEQLSGEVAKRQGIIMETLLSGIPSLLIYPLILFVLYSYADFQIKFEIAVYIGILVYLLTCMAIYGIKKYKLIK